MSPDLDLLVSLCNLDFPTPSPSKEISSNQGLDPVKGGSSRDEQAEGSTSDDPPQTVPVDRNQASEQALEGAMADHDGAHADGLDPFQANNQKIDDCSLLHLDPSEE